MKLSFSTRSSVRSTDIEMGTVPGQQRSSFSSTRSAAASSTETLVSTQQGNKQSKLIKGVQLAGAGLLVGATIGALAYAGRTIFAPNKAPSFDDQKNAWCHQLENFTWVVPNSPNLNSSTALADFHNQSQNLTQPCLDLFGSGKMLSNPQPNSIQSSFGPFPINYSPATNGSHHPSYPVITTNGTETELKEVILPISKYFI